MKKISTLWFGTVLGIAFMVTVIFLGNILVQNQINEKRIEERGPVQMVVLGDSIWDLVRDDTGVAAYLQREMGEQTTIYNCAIQGSRAAAVDREGLDPVTDDISLYAMASYIAGERTNQIPSGYEAASVLESIDFEQVDYVLIAYGLNDYFGAVQQKNPDNCYDQSTYGGALCSSIELIRNAYPNVKFMILSPTYCQGYAYGQVIHESNTYDYGGGTILDYVATAKEIADAYGYPFVDNYRDLGVSIHNGAKLLEDATHFTQKGREKYAKNLSRYILESYSSDEKVQKSEE